MKRQVLFLLLFPIFIGVSSFSKQKIKGKQRKGAQTTTAQATKPIAVSMPKMVLLCPAKDTLPPWYLAIVKGFTFPENFKSPANYRTVSIDNARLNSYLRSIPYKASTLMLTVPLFINGTLQCKEFTIERVQTMDDVLQAKYPDLMSFRVYEKANQLNAGRIDCDGKTTRFMITYDSEVYFLEPVVFKNNTYYASYSKNDPNFQKQNFESRR
ncbi:MAG TPA: hypothetical protein PLU10_08695 [Chitinophagaceae bacterium]|nr:hypothetical protein [Chitinophagaceae bacterium]